jgi:DNA-binding transcriptional regulator WhiA
VTTLLPEKTKLLADLKFIDQVTSSIEQAVLERQHELNLDHPDYLSHDLKAALRTLSIRKAGINAKLRRIEEFGS